MDCSWASDSDSSRPLGLDLGLYLDQSESTSTNSWRTTTPLSLTSSSVPIVSPPYYRFRYSRSDLSRHRVWPSSPSLVRALALCILPLPTGSRRSA